MTRFLGRVEIIGEAHGQKPLVTELLTTLKRRSFTFLFKDLLSRFLAGADAIGDADTAIAVAGERQSREPLAKAFDAFQPFQMTDAVLCHGSLPSIDPSKHGLGAQAEDLLQFIAH